MISRSRLLLIVAFIATGVSGCVIGGGFGLIVGGIAGNRLVYRNIQEEQRQALAPLLADPRFTRLEIEENLADDVWFRGHVETTADFQALKPKSRTCLARTGPH